MKNLSSLQKKYEIAIMHNWLAEQQYNHIGNLVNYYLTEAPVASGAAQPAAPAPVQPAQAQPAAAAPAPAQAAPAPAQAAPAPAQAAPAPAQAAPAPAQAAPAQPAPTASAQPANAQPASIQQAVQQVPKEQLPSLIDQLIGQIAKTNPQALGALQSAVNSNNVNAINQIIKQFSTQAPVKETTIEEVIIDECVRQACKNNDFVTIQKLHEFVNSGGDTSIITEHINENCSPDIIIEAYQELYSEGILSNIAKGAKKAFSVKNIGKGLTTVGKKFATGLGDMFGRLGKFVGKYGPWAALGAVAGGPLGAAAVPLIKAALNKWGKGSGGTTNTNITSAGYSGYSGGGGGGGGGGGSGYSGTLPGSGYSGTLPGSGYGGGGGGTPPAPAPGPVPEPAPTSITSDEVKELRALLKKGFDRTAEDNVRIKELSGKPGVPKDLKQMNKVGLSPKKRKAPGTALENKSFKNTYAALLEEFHKNSKPVPIEKANG